MGSWQHITVGSTWDGAPAGPGEVVEVALAIEGEELLVTVDAPLFDDPPPPGEAGPTARLWEHEVVEVFVLGPGERYTEIELGPHGHHLVLRLHGARRPVESGIAIDYAAVHRGPRWRGMARVPVGALPPRPWRLNAYAIHGVGAARRYLVATPLGGDAPDFHRLDAFAIEAAGPKGPREF